MTTSRSIGARRAIFRILFCALLVSCHGKEAQPNHLGVGAQSIVSGEVQVPIAAPISLNGSDAESIASLRRGVISAVPGLLAGEYQPLEDIYKAIRPDLRWESHLPYYLRKLDLMCGQGASVDSDIVLNPFMLAVPRFFGLACRYTKLIWSKEKVRSEALPAELPLYVKPSILIWFPRESRAELTVRVSDYIEDVQSWVEQALAPEDVKFSLWPINARDMGLAYMYIPPALAVNVVLPDRPNSALRLGETFLIRHLKPYPEECLSSGVSHKTQFALRLKALPAEVTLWFWETSPSDLKAPPYFTFVIKLV